MHLRITWLLVCVPVVILLCLPACGACASEESKAEAKAEESTPAGEAAGPADETMVKDIVEVAMGDENCKTLVAAVKAAGLVEILKGEGPFTVFAPTEKAFAKLPEGTVESLTQPENKEKLKAILTYHVVPGSYKAADVTKLKSPAMVKTVQGEKIKITIGMEGVKINDAKVVKTDIMASNGVIHLIDTVIMPPEPKPTPTPGMY